MKIESITKYRCDGCGVEEASPSDWQSMVQLTPFVAIITYPTTRSATDYCKNCVTQMRNAVRPA